jgi:hypothetical protein
LTASGNGQFLSSSFRQSAIVVVGPHNRMAVNVDVTAPTNTHRVNARSFPEDVVVVSMMTLKIAPPLTGGTEILAFVIGKLFGRF